MKYLEERIDPNGRNIVSEKEALKSRVSKIEMAYQMTKSVQQTIRYSSKPSLDTIVQLSDRMLYTERNVSEMNRKTGN